MKIACIGGGPAGLYFSILMKKAFPGADITVTEKNKADDTFGWGVVFSRETLGNLRAADEPSYLEIERRFVYWDDIQTFYRGTCVTSTGHGFCGLSRRQLLTLLQERAAGLGVKLEFSKELPASPLPAADLVVVSDGVHSPVRLRHAAEFKPEVDWRKCKFSWLGTTLPLTAFTFIFKETPHGLFQVHAYPFEKNLSTFIVEAREDVWKKAGLDTMSEADSVTFLEKMFAEDLKGHRLLANKSVWRTFPTIRCEKWVHENAVLLGDAAHTAHFSIGSGTKLALEDAMELAAQFVKHGGAAPVQQVLHAYEQARHPEVDRIQKAAQPSLEWFENSARYMGQPPEQLTFNLMTRSKRITWENLRLRDPKLVASVDTWFAKEHRTPPNSDGSAPPPLFAPLKLKGLMLANRVVVSPMCQYVAKDGVPDDWHLVHLGSRAMGGAGLVFTEMTDVSPEGRITLGCAGMWNDTQGAAWMRIVKFVHERSNAKIGMQLAHAGRKGSCRLPWQGDGSLAADEGAWQTVGPSALPFVKGSHVPKAMEPADLKKVKLDFGAAAVRAAAADFDVLELHMAHGYLLSSFLSPLSNQRTDAYGGSLEARLKFPLEVFDVVRKAWPDDRPLGARITAHDWMGDQGLTSDDAVEIAKALKAHGADFIDVSSGGNVFEQRPQYGRMFQVPFAEAVRYGARIPVMTVGMIAGADHANTLVAAGRADLVALARAHLSDPYLTHRHAQAEGVDSIPWAEPYGLVRPVRPKKTPSPPEGRG